MRIRIKPKRPQQAPNAPVPPARPIRPLPPQKPDVVRLWDAPDVRRTPLDAVWATAPEFVRSPIGWARRGVLA